MADFLNISYILFHILQYILFDLHGSVRERIVSSYRLYDICWCSYGQTDIFIRLLRCLFDHEHITVLQILTLLTL